MGVKSWRLDGDIWDLFGIKGFLEGVRMVLRNKGGGSSRCV